MNFLKTCMHFLEFNDSLVIIEPTDLKFCRGYISRRKNKTLKTKSILRESNLDNKIEKSQNVW